MTPLLRFLQLLCENHNTNLQVWSVRVCVCVCVWGGGGGGGGGGMSPQSFPFLPLLSSSPPPLSPFLPLPHSLPHITLTELSSQEQVEL